MVGSYKFNSSKQFCYACDYWIDRNENGLGICSNKDSEHNGQQVEALCSCRCMDKSKAKYKVVIDGSTTEHEEIPQKSLRSARQLAKMLAMDIMEDLCERRSHTDLSLHMKSGCNIKIVSKLLTYTVTVEEL